MTDPRHQPEIPTDEQRLLRDLARLAHERDPVPPELVEMARQSFTWRTVDAELAQLVADSAESQDAARVRSATAGVRLLAFATAELHLNLQVLVERDVRRLVGELDPGTRARVEVEHPGGRLEEDTDEFGRFLVAGVPGGLVRVRCRPATGRPLLTPWLRI